MVTKAQIPPGKVVTEILRIYEKGLTLDALRRAEAFAPLKEWGGIGPRLIAARIAANVGAPRLTARLVVGAWRMDKSNAAAQLQYGFRLVEQRGSLVAWRTMRRWPMNPQATTIEQAELLALKGQLAMDLRDFSAAEKLLAQAEALAPNDPWIHLQRSHLLERQDRVEEALAAAREAMALHPHPFYRPGVQATGHLLQLLDRDEEAVTFLQDAGRVLQNGPVAAQLYGILSENRRWTEAEAALEKYVELSPLLESGLQKWVTSQRARTAYHLGKRTEAAGFARTLDDEFHKLFAANLETAPETPERVHLDVSFVRQHFKTCAPATLAALGRFWKLPSEHLKLAEAMCYDGTPGWQQREWASQNGWHVREFRVTHESALALIDRGIPFAIATVEATSAHMQALVGFDRIRGTILLRDPSQPYTVERFAEKFFKYYRPFGPHGMIFIPEAERSRLDGLELPDSDVYDDCHQFQVCIKAHDRAGAAQILERMTATYGDHAQVWEMRLLLAGYDANVSEQLRCLDQLLKTFPDNPARLLRRLSCLRHASRAERLEFLERICRSQESDPVFHVELARVLHDDARKATEAASWLKRALRLRHHDANAISVQADLSWQAGQFEEATELYRFAANLESFRENLFQTWFLACRRTRRTAEAITILEDRFKRFGALSEQPGMTLAWALREMDQPQRAREIYAEAARLRPENGYLLLNAAVLEARLRRRDETEKLIAAARNKVRNTDWLRSNAEIAELRLDPAESLRASREILTLEPLALDAHGGVARALAKLEGTTRALQHLRETCDRFPHHYGLRRMFVDWCRSAKTEEAEQAARALLGIDPEDAWARRELSTIFLRAGRAAEALHEASAAALIEPQNSYSYSVLGHIRHNLKKTAEARADFRRAIELSVDNSDALRSLLDLAQTDRERKEDLAFIEAELIKQVVNGDGLLAFQDVARPILAPEALLQSLQLAHKERPDLWHAWSALGSQLGHLNRLDEALEIAKQAAGKFPHMPRIWLDLARIHRWRKDLPAEIEAARSAFEINPSWERSTLGLSEALGRAGKLDEAAATYVRALQHSAQNAQLHASYAHLLWRQQKQDEALAEIERALRIAPGYEWAWDLMLQWTTDRGEAARAGNFARTLTTERPGEMRAWQMLARVVRGRENMPERLAAADRALTLDPDSADAWDLKAELLVADERFDDAIQATVDGLKVCTTDTHILRGRRAWVEARRNRRSEAIRLMREVLTENSGYVWGWHQLAHWLIEQDALVDATAALETLQRLRPHDPWVTRQLGALQLKRDDRAGAQKSFAATLQLAPTDVEAAHRLFDLQIKSADLKGAEATLRVMQTHQPGTATLAGEILLLLKKNEIRAADAVLQKLCSSNDPDAWPLDTVAIGYQQRGLANHVLRIFRRALKTGTCHPEVGPAAIQLLIQQQRHYAAVLLFLKFKGELQRRSAATLVRGLAKPQTRLAFRWLLWRRRQVLHQNDDAWGQVGYALSNYKAYKQAALWLSDWRNRRDVQPWMLFNLCLGLRQLGKYPEASEISRFALNKWGYREGSADLRLFLAVEDALAGNLDQAQEQLRQVSIRKNIAYDQDLLTIAKALVEFQQTPVDGRAKQFKAIQVELDKRFTTGRMLKVMKDVRRTLRRAGKIFTQNGGGWRAKVWFIWKLNWQWLLAPILLVLALVPPLLVIVIIVYLVRNSRRR